MRDKIKLLPIEFEMMLMAGEDISIEDVEFVDPVILASYGEDEKK